ncbi:putative 39S ribosomal protein L47, mitochondrial precursor [Cardiosporidium cionae]|uniref:Large ribosomal subunit protein uL29m n=1 Tax=Cardiosporidium cionae TaxID=476202 RepID=A0ABQ7J6N9_9APIC|nr:putative 39S ribosomal protein L47, mitochondrial precursor [Cardiosporidium cionae]|eukprot:KAF8819658.1 putative 39S ribosomal protein L47, mitochondrial precursor [Cardiosporidium cionae]
MALPAIFRRSTKYAGSAPFRNIDELWKGGFLDPTISASEKRKNAVSGDAWPATLLRKKSFDDLHKLWYVCLKERNLLTGEKWSAWQRGISMEHPGRLKKCKLTMKRILSVMTSREIHQQCLRAQHILNAQKKREVLETERFHIEEQILKLCHQIDYMQNRESLMKSSLKAALEKFEATLEQLLIDLNPLRLETMQFVAPDWRYQRKYSDLPGPISWKKQGVPALKDQKKLPIKFY